MPSFSKEVPSVAKKTFGPIERMLAFARPQMVTDVVRVLRGPQRVSDGLKRSQRASEGLRGSHIA